MNKKKTNINKIVTEFINFVRTYIKNNPRDCQLAAIKALFNKNHPKFLFNMCCAAGKTIIESFLVYKEIKNCADNHKLARVMIASHRLLLNNQMVNIVYSALKSNGIDNVEWWSLSSNVEFKLNDGVKLTTSKFTADGIDYIKSSDKHVIIIACAASEKKHFKENDSDTMKTILNEEMEVSTSNFLNLIIQDELHKDIPIKVLRNFEKISDKIYGFTATPNNKNKEWFGEDNTFNYWFAKALEDKIVVIGKLFVCKSNASHIKTFEASSIIWCFEHLSNECKKMNITPVALHYFSSIDHLSDYAETIIRQYGDTVDVAVFASEKKIEKNKTGDGIEICCTLNGKKKSRDDLLQYCQTERDKKKPLIILSAYMIVEGINIPSINGVGIWCEKNDANMFQAACRGCRVDEENPNKTYFCIYTSEYLVTESKVFLEKLYNGFNGQLDFGDGQEDCLGTGKQENPIDKAKLEELKIVPASAVKTVTSYVTEIELNLISGDDAEKKDIELENYVNSDEFKNLVSNVNFKVVEGCGFSAQSINRKNVKSHTNGIFDYFYKRYKKDLWPTLCHNEKCWFWILYNNTNDKFSLKEKDEPNICMRWVKNKIISLKLCKAIKNRTIINDEKYKKIKEWYSKKTNNKYFLNYLEK